MAAAPRLISPSFERRALAEARRKQQLEAWVAWGVFGIFGAIALVVLGFGIWGGLK